MGVRSSGCGGATGRGAGEASRPDVPRRAPLRIVVGMTGASGAIYGIRLLQVMRDVGVESHLVLSDWARRTIELETSYSAADVVAMAARHYPPADQAAAISSGSFKTDGMVIAPCSMKTLAGISHGVNPNLVGRAADVTLKEGRRLVLVPRETPLNLIHLENMVIAARAGATILPPMPAFYNKPRDIQDLVDHVVARILDRFGVETNITRRWTGPPAP